jgi:hypothetical protein
VGEAVGEHRGVPHDHVPHIIPCDARLHHQPSSRPLFSAFNVTPSPPSSEPNHQCIRLAAALRPLACMPPPQLDTGWSVLRACCDAVAAP